MVSEDGLHAADEDIESEEGLNAADDDIISEGLHAAIDEIWCQKKGYMLQMKKYGVRRWITYGR